MLKHLTLIIILALNLNILPKTASAQSQARYTYATEINYLIARNIIDSSNQEINKLKPAITHAEALKITLRSAKPDYFEGVRLENLSKSTFEFENIPSYHWAFPYYVYAKQKKLLKDFSVDPNLEINRKEALKILLDLHQKDLPENTVKLFGDLSKSDPAYPYFAFAWQTNLLLPLETNHYQPDQKISKEEFLIITYRLIFLDQTRTEFRVMPITQTCKATFYSDFFHGRNTASGEVFDNFNGETAAHLTLPFGTTLELTDVESGQKQTVRINDRGPFDERFCLDLTKHTFEKFANPSQGWTWIEYRIIQN